MTTFGLFQPSKTIKLYITCLHYSYAITLCFLCDVIYQPNGCRANDITFVLPSNNRPNVDSIMEVLENKLGLNR